MIRKARLAAGTTILVSLSLLFVPAVPLGLTRTWSTNCPDTATLCSIGDGGLLDKGYASVAYALFGFGGVWDQHFSDYRILQNGCRVSDGGSQTVCYGRCTLDGNGLCAR